MCKKDCGCSKVQHVKVHLLKGEIRRASLDGADYLVVPVIMARGDVVMNSGLTPASEFETFAWNGVPVTLRHPQSEAGVFMSANTPDAIEKFAAGRIFNTTVVDGQLRAEAWVHIEKAEALSPGIIDRLEAGGPMDVSTGFFSDQTPAKGVVNGRAYDFVNSNLRPDHLALLPNEVGACSWDDGCGVRANQKDLRVKVQQAWAVIAEALGLKAALVANSNEEKGDETEGQGDEAAAAAKEKEQAMNKEEIAAMVAAVLKDALPAAVAPILKAHAEQVAASIDTALAPVKALQAQKKAELVGKVVANSSITKEAAEAMDLATLEVVANGLKTEAPIAADFSGRGLPAPVVNGSDAELADAITPKGLVAHFAAKKKAA